jgi:hypothetical protein
MVVLNSCSTQMPAFTSGVVLLLNIWGGKRSGLSTNPSKEMADVHKCMEAIRVCEERLVDSISSFLPSTKFHE